MSIRLAISYAATGVLAAGLGLAASGQAFAEANVLKECGSQYQTAKSANELKGQSWQDFLKACRTRITEQGQAAPAPAAAPAAAAPKPVEAAKPVEPPKAEAPASAANPLKPAAAPVAAPAAKPAKPVSAGQAAMRAREKKCGAEWKAQKVELRKSDPKITWPKYWSACNTRLKAAGE